MEAIMPRQSVIRDTSPFLLKLGKRKLVNGPNPITSFIVGGKRLRLAAVARGGKIVDWAIIGPNGNPVKSEFVKVTRQKKVTCWRCVADKDGELHCFMIPCPDIPLPPFGTAAFATALKKVTL
jgi:hypothetical protein